jgi:hypothetical protein
MRKHMRAAKVRGIREKKKGKGKKMGCRGKNKGIFPDIAWMWVPGRPVGVTGGVLRLGEGEFGNIVY